MERLETLIFSLNKEKFEKLVRTRRNLLAAYDATAPFELDNMLVTRQRPDVLLATPALQYLEVAGIKTIQLIVIRGYAFEDEVEKSSNGTLNLFANLVLNDVITHMGILGLDPLEISEAIAKECFKGRIRPSGRFHDDYDPPLEEPLKSMLKHYRKWAEDTAYKA